MIQITRKRALELAMTAIGKEMDVALNDWRQYENNKSNSATTTKIYRDDGQARYSELAAALDYIERLARQKELL